MTPPLVSQEDLQALREGSPPRAPDLLRYLQVPAEGWPDLLRREYLQTFIPEGGTRLKLLVGTPGTGKSHLLALAAEMAREDGFLVASLDAAGAYRLFPIDRFYAAVVSGARLHAVIEAYAARAVAAMGFEGGLPRRGSFLEHAVREGLGAEAALRRSLREAVDRLLQEPALDPTFAVGAATLVGDRLGVFRLNEAERGALDRWFTGEKVSLRELKPVQVYEAVTRYNARDHLRSLVVLARLSGFRGLVVCVDNLETLVHRSPISGRARYTRAQRDDAYETLRQLIDDVDRSRSALYLLAGRRELLDDERTGLSSYEALRLRLMQEVRATRVNLFADLLDLDAARARGYPGSEALSEWLGRVRELHSLDGPAPVPPPNLSLRDLVLAVSAE